MNSRRRTWLIIILSALVLLVAAEYILFETSGISGKEVFELNAGRLHAMAAEKKGPLPLRVNALVLADARYPEIAVTAGGSFFKQRRLVTVAYQIVYPNKDTILIDTANDQTLHDEWSNGTFRPRAFARLQAAMLRARMIFITHEHFDHLGGVSKSPNLSQLYERVRLTPEQITGPTIEWAGFPPGALKKFKPLEYKKYHAPAPGIVLVKAPGHTAGSQMIYARLANGGQYLFVGDIAWGRANIRRPVGKALLAAMMARENRALVGAQLRTLNRLERETKIHIIVSHDADQLKELRAQGVLGSGFE